MAPIVMNASNGVAENGKFSPTQSKFENGIGFYDYTTVHDSQGC